MKNVKRIENYRFVLQECDECGAKFPVIYMFKEHTIAPFGFACEHVPSGGDFIPADGQPTFDEWYQEQLRVRGLLVCRS